MCNICNPKFMAFMRAYGGRRDTLRRLGAGVLFTGVGADPSLSHRADRVLSQGWKPVLS
jgi:hypothetical protein